MGLWEAVIAIVAMGIISDTVGKVLKTRSKARADDSKVKSLTDKIDALNAQLSELSIENETLKTELEEQKILADEAVSTFGSGLERLKAQGRISTAKANTVDSPQNIESH